MTSREASISSARTTPRSLAVRQSIFFLWRPLLRDPKDDMVAEVAAAAGCGAIVTHNVDDFAGVERLGIAPIAPATFLKRLRGTP